MKKLHSYKIFENLKFAKSELSKGSLSQEDFDYLLNLDKSTTKKYIGWMVKHFKGVDENLFRNKLEEFQSLNMGDIYRFKTFDELEKAVDIENNKKSMSFKEQAKEYDVIIDNEDMFLVSPHSHEASRKLGLKYFAFRTKDGVKDCAWCTTYSNNANFNDYYYNQNDTFYYLLDRKNNKAYAFQVHNDGDITTYDELDNKISNTVIDEYNLKEYLKPYKLDGRFEKLAKLYEKMFNETEVWEGGLSIEGLPITTLGKVRIIKGGLNLSINKTLKSLGNLEIVEGDLYLSNNKTLKSLGNLEIVEGSLFLVSSNIEDLGNLKEVNKSLWLAKNKTLKSLSKLEKIEWSLSLENTDLNDLGELKYIGDNIWLRNSKLDNIGKLEYVGGSWQNDSKKLEQLYLDRIKNKKR